MDKLVSAFVLVLLSGNASAAWTFVAKSDSQTIYADKATVRQSGAFARMWALSDLATPAVLEPQEFYWSTTGLYEFDCKELKSRILQATAYERQMGMGAVVTRATKATEWSYVQPDTALDSWRLLACEKPRVKSKR
jgi:hypothetical protein